MSGSTQILFDKFEIIECFKKDEHSGVYLAHHIYLGKKIILKSLSTVATPDPSIVERFKREAKILAKLDHPNIIKVLDFGLYEEHFYISFEYIEGKSLRKYLNDNLSDEQKLQIVIQILKGLSYAHQHKIIHRDLKPENIFIGDDLKARIGDFGLALSEMDSFVTNQYSIVGTPCYMSPEQVKGEPLTLKSDLFSVGIVILELFTGKNPFLGSDVNESINNIINYDFDDVEKWTESVSDELKELLSFLLKKNSKDRIATASDALKILNYTEDAADIKTEVIEKKSKIAPTMVIAFAALIIIAAVYWFTDNSVMQESKVSEFDNQVAFDSQLVGTVQATDKNINEKESVVDKDLGKSEEKEIIQPKAVENKSVVPSVKRGELFVECIPWGDVIVDGKKIETTPLSNNIELKEGEHDLKLVHPDYPEYSSKLNVVGDSLVAVKVNLNNLWGYLVCNLHPWGEVYLGEKHLGTSPFNEPIKLKPNNYNLSMRNPNLGENDTNIVVTRGDTVVVNYKFKTEN